MIDRCPPVRAPWIAVFGIVFGMPIGASTMLADESASTMDTPSNLAARARVSASSEYSEHYSARFAVDGKLPAVGGQADLDQAWCVRGEQAGGKGEIRFEWDEPVTIGEVVYFGRTAWFESECWKDFEILAEDGAKPIATGSLRMEHGPQRITVPSIRTRRLVMRFLSGYGGPNPGASEILIHADRLNDRELAKITRRISMAGGGTPGSPVLDEVDPDHLRRLIVRLMRTHADHYPQGADHLARVDALTKADRAKRRGGETAADEPGRRGDAESDPLVRLQRDVLLFDVERFLVIERHEITASHVYTYHYEGFRPGGGLYVVSANEPGLPPLELVASPTGQILDCDLSHDGGTVVFSWRRREDEGYHVWTIDVDGTDLRQITDGDWHDYNACWLPDGDIAFLTTRSPQFAYCWHAPVGVLHRMKADGTGLTRLSANYLNDFTPQVLDDGRLIYTRWEYVDRPAIPIQSLWTIHPDGTGLAGFFGNRVLSPGTFMEARQVPGTRKVICTMTGHNGPTRGAIGLIDRGLGDNAQASIENLTPDVPVPSVDRGDGNTGGTKQYSSPIPLDAARFLASARGPVIVRSMDGTCQSTALPAPSNGMQRFQAQPIRARDKPRVIPSRVSPDAEPFATILLQDVHDGLGPTVAPNEIKAIRIVRDMRKSVRIDPSLRAFGFQFPVISCGATYAAKDVLGDVPVESDGSACFRVPAGVNLSFMAIDGRGRAVQRMRSFTHLMPGETQGCVGCHEHRGQSPRPHSAMALEHPPREITPPEWGAGGFDYSRVVQPVLDRHCAECHGPVDAPGRVDLTGDKTDFFNVSYEMLARENQGPRGSPYVNWIPTYNGQEWNILEIEPKTWGSPRSPLADLILSGHPDGHGKPRVHVDDAGIRRVLAWIDLNVPYYGTSETAYPDRVGCRRIYPERLDETLENVASRRCATCHEKGAPRRDWTRITNPAKNAFLLAPLARSAGGSQRCGLAVFASTEDPDYQMILATFAEIETMLRENPRMDMPGARPAPEVCRTSR